MKRKKFRFEVVLRHRRWKSKQIWEKKTGYSEVVEIPEAEIQKHGLGLAVSLAGSSVVQKWKSKNPEEVRKAAWFYSTPGWFSYREKEEK